MDWINEPFIQTGYSCPAVNEITTIGDKIHEPINSVLYLAGEYACRYKWCGYMEGALLSGVGVAKKIMKHTENTQDIQCDGNDSDTDDDDDDDNDGDGDDVVDDTDNG